MCLYIRTWTLNLEFTISIPKVSKDKSLISIIFTKQRTVRKSSKVCHFQIYQVRLVTEAAHISLQLGSGISQGDYLRAEVTPRWSLQCR